MRKTRFIVVAIAVLAVAGAAALAGGLLRPTGAVGAEKLSPAALLTVPGVNGGNPIQLDSVTWGVTMPECATCGPGGGTGKPILTHVAIARPIDTLSPAIFRSVVQGEHFPNAAIDLLNASGQKYLRYRLEEVIITELSHSAKPGGVTSESLSLAFGSIELTAGS